MLGFIWDEIEECESSGITKGCHMQADFVSEMGKQKESF